jgi:hypothetical protein
LLPGGFEGGAVVAAARLPLLRMIVAQVTALTEPAQTGELRTGTVLAQVRDGQDDPDRPAGRGHYHVPMCRGVGIADDGRQMRHRTAPLRVQAPALPLALTRIRCAYEHSLAQRRPVGRIDTRTKPG